MFYITVLDDRRPAVVSDGRGRPREFPTNKKARNFVDGRPYLKRMKPRISEDISRIRYNHRVDI